MTPEEFIKEKSHLTTLLHRHEKRLLKRIEKAHEELSLSRNWKEAEKEGELLKAHFPQLKRGMKSITVQDWESEQERTIILNPKLQPQQEVALRYRQSKKRQKAIPHLEGYITGLEEEKKELEACLSKLEKAETVEEVDAIRKFLPQPPTPAEKKQKEVRTALPYNEFISSTGQKIWVGKSAKDNEKLTFVVANGSDWWLHAHGCPGSHVIIRTDKGQDPDNDTLQEAMKLAITYSKAKSRGEGDVCVTQRKYVTRFGKGQVGKVQVSKHKLIYTRI